MSDSIITKYTQYCLLCGTPASETHHCLKGVGKRHLAESDGLKIPICRKCHDEIHRHSNALNVAVEIIGQLAWERQWIIYQTQLPFDDLSEEARDAFRQRYGKSFL